MVNLFNQAGKKKKKHISSPKLHNAPLISILLISASCWVHITHMLKLHFNILALNSNFSENHKIT